MRPFERGKRAFWKGDISNPYPDDSIEHREWQYGFDRAYFNNLENVRVMEAAGGKTSYYLERIKSGRGSKEVYKESTAEEIN